MRNQKILFLLFMSSIFYACSGNAQNNVVTNKAKSTNKIEVLDFHTAHRCTSCLNIEAYTKETLNKYFTKEMKEGKITFALINADEKVNEKLVEKFGAYGTTLCLNVIKNGNETPHDITEFAFLKVSDKKVFIAELKKKIEELLTKI